MPTQPKTIKTQYVISFQPDERAFMKHEGPKLLAQVKQVPGIVDVRISEGNCRDVFYSIFAGDDKPEVHHQVLEIAGECLQSAKVEMSLALQDLPARVADEVVNGKLSPPEIVPVVLEFISRGGGAYETWSEDFHHCTKEALMTTTGASKKLSPEIQSLLDEAGWGPGKTVQYLVEFTFQGRPYDRLGWAQEVDLFLARCVTAERAVKGEPSPEPEQMSLGLR